MGGHETGQCLKMRGSGFRNGSRRRLHWNRRQADLKKQASVVGLGKVTSVAEDRAELEPGTAALRVRRLTTRLRCLLNRRKLACARASSLFRVASEESRERTRERVDLLQSCLLSRVALAWLLATPPKGELARKLKKVEASLFLSPPRNNKYNRQHHKNMKISLFKFTKKIYRSG